LSASLPPPPPPPPLPLLPLLLDVLPLLLDVLPLLLDVLPLLLDVLPLLPPSTLPSALPASAGAVPLLLLELVLDDVLNTVPAVVAENVSDEMWRQAPCSTGFDSFVFPSMVTCSSSTLSNLPSNDCPGSVPMAVNAPVPDRAKNHVASEQLFPHPIAMTTQWLHVA
jgi:hypothetical protein